MMKELLKFELYFILNIFYKINNYMYIYILL